jgi:pyruvate-formate lyase
MIEKIIEYKIKISAYEQFLDDIKDKKNMTALRNKYTLYVGREKKKLAEAVKLFNQSINENQG